MTAAATEVVKKKRKSRAKAKPTEAVAQPAQPKKLFSLDLLKSNLAEFGELTETKRGQILSALNYIEMLGSTTGTNLSNWDIFDVFGQGTSDIATSQDQINKNFFGYLEQKKNAPVAPEQAPQLTDELKTQMNEVAQGLLKARQAQLKSQRDQHLRSAKDYQAHADNYLSAAYQAQLELDSMRPDQIEVSKHVEELLQDKFWTFVGINGKKLRLATAAGVTSNHKPHGGETRIVNFGRMLAEIDLEKMNVIVMPYEGNTMAGGFFHPHIRENGRVCWGNGASSAQKYLSTGQLAQVMRLLAAVLTSYNNVDGYMHIVESILAAKKPMTAEQILNTQKAYSK